MPRLKILTSTICVAAVLQLASAIPAPNVLRAPPRDLQRPDARRSLPKGVEPLAVDSTSQVSVGVRKQEQPGLGGKAINAAGIAQGVSQVGD